MNNREKAINNIINAKKARYNLAFMAGINMLIAWIGILIKTEYSHIIVLLCASGVFFLIWTFLVWRWKIVRYQTIVSLRKIIVNKQFQEESTDQVERDLSMFNSIKW